MNKGLIIAGLSVLSTLPNGEIGIPNMYGNAPIYYDAFCSLSIAQQDVLAKLNLLQNLDEDWDGYGAPKISTIAINNCQSVINQLSLVIIQNVNVLPSEFGGVQLEMEKDNGIVNCDFGDDTFSYYVEKKGAKTEYYSFLEYTEKNVQTLINNFSLISNV